MPITVAVRTRSGRVPVTLEDDRSTLGDLRRAIAAAVGVPKPRNPRHFDRFEGGSKRVSYIFTHKDSGSRIKRATTTVSCTIVAFFHVFSTAFHETKLRG